MSGAGQRETAEWPPLSAWDVLGLPGQVQAASFLTTPLAHQYRLIVETLARRQSVSLTGVGHDELLALVVERLPEHSVAELVDELNLDARLDSLVGSAIWWSRSTSSGVCRADDRLWSAPMRSASRCSRSGAACGR